MAFRTRLALLASLVVVALVAAGCGGDADRTIEVEMVDVAFSPKTIDVRRGETVRFVFRNRGAVAHDAFIGDAAAQREHDELMKEGDGHGEGEDAITLDPGETGEVTYTFTEAGEVEVGCHQPGHYAAGMKIAITVT